MQDATRNTTALPPRGVYSSIAYHLAASHHTCDQLVAAGALVDPVACAPPCSRYAAISELPRHYSTSGAWIPGHRRVPYRLVLPATGRVSAH